MKKNYHTLFITVFYGITLLILALTFIVAKSYNIPFERITGDPANYYNFHPFTGIVSNIGALLWCITASICTISGILLFHSKAMNEAYFLLFSGFFSFILLIDDFFMIHDYLFYSLHQFILEPFIYIIYAFLILRYCIKYYKIVLEHNYIIFGAALFFLGLSVVIDLILPSEGIQYFIEDSLKFLGITSWMLFYSITSFSMLSKKITPSF